MHISLINLPRYEIHRPPLSLAILSALCSAQNVAHDCYDFSLRIYQELPEHLVDIDNYCITGNITDALRSRLRQSIRTWIVDIIDSNPDTVFAISLLSTWSQNICQMVCEEIRSLSTNQILLGGQGLADSAWNDRMLSSGCIDWFMIGEAEVIFPKFLQGYRNLPGLNNYNNEQIDDLDTHVVIPDYRKLKIEQYPHLGERLDLFITASRGCVRRCSYCDIGHQWKKYRYRSAKQVAAEMIAQYERHGITDFFFTDSLINGSMKMLDELCDELIDYRQQHSMPRSFSWKGQYIFRPKNTVKERHIARLKEAGVDYLIVGLETGSDRVRYDMNKKHTMEDAEYFLELFKKYGIKCHLLMITGWVTETLDDHNETLKMFERWQKFVASGTITGIELGSTLTILEHSPVGEQIDYYGIQMLDNKPYLWQADANPELTIHERIRRRVETHRVAMKYQWPITRSLYRLNTIKRSLQEAIETLSNRQRRKIIPLRLVEPSL
jgi:hypothetical protein